MLVMLLIILNQNLPIGWSQSYCTFDQARVLNPNFYSLGFGFDNYCIYSSTHDTIAYDERRFDIWARIGILKRAEFELKYSYPTAGVISIKYLLFESIVAVALKSGFGYMKGTRTGYITDYVYDFYGNIFIEKCITNKIKFVYTPKFIYSMHFRDRQEHTDRPPNFIPQFGHCISLAIGKNFVMLPEANWLWGKNKEVNYMVNQYGLGVNISIN